MHVAHDDPPPIIDAVRARRGLSLIAFVVVGVPMLVVIRLYKVLLSPFLAPACRFSPSCSAYGYEAVHLHGPLKGGVLAATRIARCHPWNAGGFDPVPESTLARRFVVQADGSVVDNGAHTDDEARA